jgi:hypothetical protein
MQKMQGSLHSPCLRSPNTHSGHVMLMLASSSERVQAKVYKTTLADEGGAHFIENQENS